MNDYVCSDFYLSLLLGSVVRVSPREVAVNTPEGIKTICKDRGGFLKSKWYDRSSGQGLVAGTNPRAHARLRRLLASPLSLSSLVQSEPLVRAKIDLAMEKIRQEDYKLGYSDVYKWFNLMATDIIGDATFGSSFRMLEQGHVS